MGVSGVLRQFFSNVAGAYMCSNFISGFGVALILIGVFYAFRERSNPEAVKQREIDEKDERNIRIKEKAGYATWHVTLLMLVAMAFVFIFMDYVLGFWIVAGAVVFHKLMFVVFSVIYGKRM